MIISTYKSFKNIIKRLVILKCTTMGAFTKIAQTIFLVALFGLGVGCTQEVGISINKDTPSATVSQQVDAESLTNKADQYFIAGNYDEALKLYKAIDSEYARSRIRSIECIPVAEQIAKEWLSQTDDQVINKTYFAFLGLDFKLDAEYDVEKYIFYTKISYPSLYTTIATIAGATKEDISEGITSNGFEKITYQMFCEQGYEDITCVLNVYDGNGDLLCEFPYGQAEYKADLEQEAVNDAIAQQQIEERKRIEREFVSNMNSNIDFRNAAIEAVNNTGSYYFAEVVCDYYRETTGTDADFTIESDFQYGSFWAVDLEEMDNEIEHYEVWNDDDIKHIVVHLPCAATVRLRHGEKQFFDVEYDVAIEVDPKLMELTTRLTNYSARVLSMKENTSFWDTINPDRPGPWLDNDDSTSWGKIGDTLQAAYITATLNNAYTTQTYGGSDASPGSQFLIISLSLTNANSGSTLILDDDLFLLWNSGHDEALIPPGLYVNNTSERSFYMTENNCYKVTLVYEVSKEIRNFVLGYSDVIMTDTAIEGKSICFNIPSTT